MDLFMTQFLISTEYLTKNLFATCVEKLEKNFIKQNISKK